MKRWLFALLIVCALALVGGAGYLGTRNADESHPVLPAVPQTVSVTRGNVQQTVTAPGELIGTRRVALSLDVGGKLSEFDLRPGDLVKAGQVLARLDPAPFERALRKAELALARAQAEHARQLSDARLAVEAAQLELQEAQASHARQLAEAEAAVQAAKARLNQAQLQYPDLVAVEIHLNAAIADEAYAADAYKQALDRPWEPNAVREGLLRAWNAAQDALEIAQAEYDRALNGQRARDQDLLLLRADVEQAEAERAGLDAAIDPLSLLRCRQAQEALSGLEASGIDPLLQFAVDEARAELASLTLAAPFGGIVVEIMAHQGETVGPDTALLVLADPTAVEIEGSIVEEDAPLVDPGQAVELFFDAAPDKTSMGEVARIVPHRLPGERPLYPIYIVFTGPVPAELLPGMTVDASILVAQRTGVLRLPRSLVKARADDTATVEVWTGSGVETRTVQVGLRGDAHVEILSGLREGDRVVVG